MPVNVTILGRDIKYAALRAAEQVANEAADKARELCPKKSGNLERSITVEAVGEGFQVIADEPYASAEEFGTAHQEPHPFMQPAAAYAAAVLPARVAAAVKEMLGG